MAIKRTITSLSTSAVIPSNHVPISSTAANLAFQLASEKPAVIPSGTKDEARTSASSLVYLYLNVSNAPGGAGGGGLADLLAAAVALAAGGFLAGPPAGADSAEGPDAAEAAVFFACLCHVCKIAPT